MKKLIAVAVLALVGATAAEAKVHELRFGGRTARIEIPNGCKKISCIRVNDKTKARSSRRSSEPSYEEQGNQQSYQQQPQQQSYQQPAYQQQAQPQQQSYQQPVAPQAAAPAPQQARAGAIAPGMAPGFAPAPAAPQAEPQSRQSQQEPDDRIATARLSLPNAAVQAATAAAQAAAPAIQAAAPAAQEAPAQYAQPERDLGPTPVGLWLTQKKEAKIRVVECGSNICGHVEGKPSEKVLINMKPTGGNRWNGTIHDIRRGGNYSAHISLKGPYALKVTGCAFGGMFCGGETWTRAQ
jgi:uncharacterized protein (DUF2147 family)